jgi:hypothetical protein
MADPNSTPPAVSYQNTPGNLAFYNPNPMPAITSATPSFPTPMQGECFPNCPLMAALDAITWVNRQFIPNNITGPTNNNYTFTFWDYGIDNSMTVNNSMPGTVSLNGPITPVSNGTPITPVKAQVSVGNQVLLDANNRFSDPNGTFYGAGSNNANEVWPALFERAYAKFCYYENGMTPSTGALIGTKNANINTITGSDPAYSDLQTLGANPPTNYWGGNAAIALAYLTGLNSFQLSTTLGAFNVPEYSSLPSSVNSTSLYTFIKAAFCSYSVGLRKTQLPLVAWTYENGSQFSSLPSQGILASHCYAILGTFDSTNGCTNGHSYIVLRTTFGLSDPLALTSVAPSGCGSWEYKDLGFVLGNTTQSGLSAVAKTLNLSTPTDAIFGLDATVFSNYFQAIGWCEGFTL